MNQTFSEWYKVREAAFEMESQILLDKLQQGINGIEWLVQQVIVDSTSQESLDQWLNFLRMYGYYDPLPVIRDALLMGDEEFYRKYEFNWWISVDDALTYLNLLREREYGTYFNFIQGLEKGEVK